jgi:hypothetical protein
MATVAGALSLPSAAWRRHSGGGDKASKRNSMKAPASAHTARRTNAATASALPTRGALLPSQRATSLRRAQVGVRTVTTAASNSASGSAAAPADEARNLRGDSTASWALAPDDDDYADARFPDQSSPLPKGAISTLAADAAEVERAIPAFLRNSRRTPDVKDAVTNPMKFAKDLASNAPLTGQPKMIQDIVHTIVAGASLAHAAKLNFSSTCLEGEFSLSGTSAEHELN